MTKRKQNAYIDSLLPLYANGRASGIQRRLVRFWLGRNPEANQKLNLMRTVKKTAQIESNPPSKVAWANIQSRIETPAFETRVSIRQGPWRMGMGFAVLLLVLVWFVFPPKVVLEWRVEGTTPQEFRVYRSVEAGSQNFTLVEEIPAAGSSTDYQFVDLQLIPGREYAYRIEAISPGGEPMTSELIRSDSSSALPSQMALLLTFSVSIYGLAVFLSEKMHWPAENLRFRVS